MDKDLAAVIAERMTGFTKLEKRVAAYRVANPEAILVETSGTIADRSFVSPMTVTRFFRKLGFENAAAVKSQARQRFTRSTPAGIGGRRSSSRCRPRPASSSSRPADPFDMPLLKISHPAVDIDLRYATADNLTGRPIYERAVALLHPEANRALLRAADLAAAQGLRLRVYDAYRPVAAQWRLWETHPDPTFVADPVKGSLHNRGVAIDLTLASADGVPLDMGTGFDDMTEQSFHARTDIPVDGQRHRALLLGLMAASGWAHHPHEWWHYNLRDWERYPPLDDAVEGRLLMNLPQ